MLSKNRTMGNKQDCCTYNAVEEPHNVGMPQVANDCHFVKHIRITENVAEFTPIETFQCYGVTSILMTAAEHVGVRSGSNLFFDYVLTNPT
jgi:hypothetical protein